jgi:hypothetical protein
VPLILALHFTRAKEFASNAGVLRPSPRLLTNPPTCSRETLTGMCPSEMDKVHIAGNTGDAYHAAVCSVF